MAVADDDDLVAFFRAMPQSRRREYDALAELDRRFGEDVEAEVRARPTDARRARDTS